MGKIKFVSVYKIGINDMYDVIYSSGRSHTGCVSDMPKTVKVFMDNATKVSTYYDCTMSRTYTVYENA